MSSLLRTVEFLSLGTLVGGIIFLNFGVAPGAFATLGGHDLAVTFLSSSVPLWLPLLVLLCGLFNPCE